MRSEEFCFSEGKRGALPVISVPISQMKDFTTLVRGEGSGQKDAGRAAVTRNPDDFGKFKTPSLRNIERTAPYMHDGSLSRLEDVIEFYNRGGRPNSHLDAEMKPLALN